MKQLLQIQSELKAPKNQVNSFGKYKYRNAEDIYEAVKPLLSKYGCTLTLSDDIKAIGSITYVEAIATLCHNEDCVKVTAQAGIDPNRKGMDISQSFGSSSSYARKYALSGLFLLDDSQDADATNTHGKIDIESEKKELTQMVIKLPETKRKSALEFIEQAKNMDDILTIKNAFSKY